MCFTNSQRKFRNASVVEAEFADTFCGVVNIDSVKGMRVEGKRERRLRRDVGRDKEITRNLGDTYKDTGR